MTESKAHFFGYPYSPPFLTMLEKVLFILHRRLCYTGTADYPNLTSLLRRVNPLCEPAAGGKPFVFLPDKLVLPSLGGDNFTLGRRVYPIQRIPLSTTIFDYATGCKAYPSVTDYLPCHKVI